jgi:hypothetical protein
VALDIIFAVLGLAIAGLTLSDVFKTVVEPGGSDAFLRVTRRLTFALLPVWKRTIGRREGVSGMFAPLVLVASFVIWVLLLILGFGLVAYGARAGFDPPLKGFWDAFFFVGSSIVTIGLSETSATGAARWVVLGAGFCGLAVITLAVTYLLLMQNSVAQRDTGILKLNTSAGEPPSALALFEHLAQLKSMDELPETFRRARDWCAAVRQSHASHPSLIYFQSIGAGVGWPAALGAMLDLGLFAEDWIDDDRLLGPGALLAAEARGMAQSLTSMVGLDLKPLETSETILREVQGRLSRAGYPLRAELDLALFAAKRSHAHAPIAAMADHLGKPTTLLLPPSS